VLFFSSRRRHTRSKRDWSSDVCSSDLNYERIAQLMVYALSKVNTIKQPLTNFVIGPSPKKKRFPEKWFGLLQLATYVEVLKHFKIGRASCRARELRPVHGGAVHK